MDYGNAVDIVTDYRAQFGRVTDLPLVGPLTGPLKSFAKPPGIKDGILTAVGAAVGAYLWKQHRVLGALGGASLGRNLPAVLTHDRYNALYNMAVTGVAIMGARTYQKHPVYGFAGGWTVANLATYFAGRR